MAKLGMNVSPSGSDTPYELWEAGVDHVRVPLWPQYDMEGLIASYVASGIDVLPCFDTNTASVAATPDKVAEYWSKRVGYLVNKVSWAFNEFDQEGSTSSTASREAVVAHLKAGRKYWTHHLYLGPNLASGQPDRWTREMDDLVDAGMLSRYPDPLSEMADGLYGPQGYKRFGSPFWFGEFPIWTPDYVKEALRLSDGIAYAYNWQSWHVNNNAFWHDGVISLTGERTWRYDIVVAENFGGPLTLQDLARRVQSMEEKQDKMEEVQRKTLSGLWDEARIWLDAIDPDMAGKWTNIKSHIGR